MQSRLGRASRLAVALIGQLLPLVQQIAAYDKEIEQLFLSHEDNEVFSSLQALGGTSPVLFQSGNYSKPHRRLGCIKPLRNALHQFAWQSTLQEGWASAYYERKRARCGKSHSVAIRALSNIWARILFAMLKSHEPSVTATFETAQGLHAPTAA